MSTETEYTPPRSVAECDAELRAVQADIKAIESAHGTDVNKFDAETLDAYTASLQYAKELQELRKELPDPAAVKAMADEFRKSMNTPVRRPAFGAGEVKGTGVEPNAVKADRIDDSQSEFEKYVDKGPFKSFGHFAAAVRGVGRITDPRNIGGLIGEYRDRLTESDNAIKALWGDVKANPTGLGEFNDGDGGLLVPIQFSQGIWQRTIDNGFSMLSLVNPIPVTGKTYKVRAYDDKSRTAGNRMGGINSFWAAEAAQYTTTKPSFRSIDLNLYKLTVLVHATEEFLDDVPGYESEITRVAADELRFATNNAFFRGTGGGQPLGMLNAACKVAITSTAGANTITAANLDDMFARRGEPQAQNYVWLCNQDTEPQLARLNYATGNAATWAYVPGGLFDGSAPPRLKGKPVYYTEFNASLGTEGDIILMDPSAYAVIVKSTGVKSAVSMHLRFDFDETVFKFNVRMDARPYWEAPVTRFQGANTLSPIITIGSTRT